MYSNKKYVYILVCILIAAIAYFKFSESNSESNIAGRYINATTMYELFEDRTYSKYYGQLDISGTDMRTADPNSEVPMNWSEQKRGNWSIQDGILYLDSETFRMEGNSFCYNNYRGTFCYDKQ